MNPLHLIEKVPGLSCVQRGGDVSVEGVVYDSRRSGPNMIFVALVGSAADGHSYLTSAYERGCRCVLVSRDVDLPDDVTVLQTTDTRAILGRVAAEVYKKPSTRMTVIGVTGTNGKTTCAALTEQLLTAQGLSVGVFGTLNIRWPGQVIEAVNTTPESCVLQEHMAQMEADGVTHVVMEVSSHGLATHRLNGTLFDVAVFTNLSQDHLDFHPSMEAYRDAKFRLFLELLPDSAAQGKAPRAVVNVADSTGRLLAEKLRDSLTYGVSGADMWAEDIQFTTSGTNLQLHTSIDELNGRRATSPLHGDFNVENLLAATLACLACGAEPEKIVDSWALLQSPDGRLQVAGPGIFVDYAHTPDALQRALLALRVMDPKRVLVVFGCGGDRDRGKRGPMGRVAAENADVLVLTSDNPRSEDPETILDDIAAGVLERPGREVYRIVDRRAAIQKAVEMMGEGDVLLVAGKGHETYQEIHGKRHRLDDVEEVRRAREKCGQ